MAAASTKIEEAELLRLVQDEAMRLPDMDLAISGLAGRFPKSDSVSEFEANLLEGLDMINDQDDSRFSCALWNLPPRAGRLKDLSKFDSEFFGFTVEEANYVDFQMRILYEVVYESILDAGINPASLRGSNTGVFFGLHCNEFENAMADDPNFKSNGYYAQYAVKVAQYFDLRGLTLTFDAACASGFVGLHNAVRALDDGIIDRAIVCSCNIPIHPTGSFVFLQMQMLSPTGYSRFLDSRADGYVKSEACVSMLLQRKPEALRNYCSIMATMTSVDGYKKEGITFPSDSSQERLIRSCKELAGISVNHIEYLEAHGTGTPAGDPQEARAISGVYYPPTQTIATSAANDQSTGEQEPIKPEEEVREEEQRIIGPLLVGSVKTNMGHSEAASGLCALAKVALMLENELIYKSLHYAQPNSNIESLMDGRIKFVDETTKLNGKIIPLSCYGFGGANVHAIVRANHRPAIEEDAAGSLPKSQPLRLIVMFGRSKEALSSFFDQLINSDSRATRNCLTDDFLGLIDNLNRGPMDRLMDYRGYLVVDRSSEKNKELARSIRKCELSPEQSTAQVARVDLGRRAHPQDCAPRSYNLFFPGLGAQWSSMGAGLTGYQPFWSTIERLCELLAPFEAEVKLRRLLVEPAGETTRQLTMVDAFVSIVAYQLALVNILRDQLKLERVAHILGHSLGEISCAYAAGLFSEREAIMVAYRMGSCLDQNKHLIAGKMFALAIDEEEAQKRIGSSYETVRVCCVNGPSSVTISGNEQEMDQFVRENSDLNPKQIDSAGIALHNDVIMGPEIRQLLEDALLIVLFPGADYNRKNTNWVSLAGSEHAMCQLQANARYFAGSLCRKVDLNKALGQLADDSIIIELGPSGLFESQLLQVEASTSGAKFHYVKMMQRGTPIERQPLKLIESIGQLYQAGASMNLTHFHLGSEGERLLFPVRRRTPSLSSLFQWNHQQSLFVPRYPVQFSKSSAKSEMPFDIVQDRDKYLAGHCIEGRILYPATGYLYLIWRVFSFTKRQVFDACFQDVEHELVPIEFRDVRLLRAIIMGGRSVQVYVHFEEGTGRFEVKEGGSVVAEGYAFLPQENPTGLLYEGVRDKIVEEKLELSLNPDDIYKQFRVSGYDYGDSFRNIEASSADGRYCRIKHNGHFVALTDSILQSIFLAITQYAPSGGLFLPTRFEYVRFQPEMILNKMRAAKVIFDLSDGSLNTQAKREIMTKIMQREMAEAKGEPIEAREEEKKEEEVAQEEEKPTCIFDTYCDPITGVIITDGIEMRGIKASPAPRRSDNNSEVMLESYQFVPDHESPVNDEPLTRYKLAIEPYARVCNSMSIQLLAQLCNKTQDEVYSWITQDNHLLTSDQIRAYKLRHLTSIYGPQTTGSEVSEADEIYDIKKNGERTLMSVLDQLCGTIDHKTDPKLIKETVQKNRIHLMRDMIQSPMVSERFMRPLVELVLENSCLKKSKLRMLEINLDDGLMRESLQQLVQGIAPTTNLDYALAHPDVNRISNHKALAGSAGQQASSKIYQLKADSNLQALFADHQIGELDLIVYKDISCYSLPKQVIEQNGLAPVLSSLNSGIRLGGYVMVVMRQQLTLAERILLALSEPELAGLSKRDLEQLCQLSKENLRDASRVIPAISKLDQINSVLSSRCKLMLSEAERNRMLCLSTKTDPNGCTVFLFKSTFRQVAGTELEQQLAPAKRNRLVLRVTHKDQQSISHWLEQLKSSFKPPPKEPETIATSAAVETAEPAKKPEAVDQEEEEALQVIWLCAVATKDSPISGLVGMMQALGKELGWSRLRCFYDRHTFKDFADDSQEVDWPKKIEQSPKFREALERDLVWNCVDSEGRLGCYRHFTLTEYMGYEDCLCSNSNLDEDCSFPAQGAYVNNATRGDLSSFYWHEAPYKYLSDDERKGLVRVAYSALNFRDIMLASGRLPLDAISLRYALSDCLLGLEFSGIEAASGRRVLGMLPARGIATQVICSQTSGFKLEMPDWLSLAEAATIPVVYATAIMALVCRGRMQRGESVLIHAASGGVGQAAIRLAAHHGLKIFATVGSEEKRNFLLEEFGQWISEDRVFSSRDCAFEHLIMEATGGRGVDLVLNSLADDKLQASVRCLADGGRFLEIGKYDLSMNTQLELLKLDTNKTFHGILLDKLFDFDEVTPAFERQLKEVLANLRQGLAEGYVRPIKHTVFKRNKVEEAFRFMATGKHIGKVLIEIGGERMGEQRPLPVATEKQQLSCIPRCQFSPNKSYIVTGGLGGFGLELTKWLVAQGARRILLTSRTGLRTGYQRSTLLRLESSNSDCSIRVVASREADACSSEGAGRLMRLAEDLSPSRQVGGVFHLAMVLKDTLLENMSAEDFERVCRPKVAACEQLDRVSRKWALDYFVAFSSVTSGKGNAGQANYAYANSCLERVCEERRRAGEHGLAIQWGAIGDVGVAFENLGGNNVVVGGTLPQRMPSCLATLGRLLAAPFATCLSVVPANRSQANVGEKGDLVAAIMHVLGIKDASKVSEQATLGELGLDSLMAVEIRQYIEREYEMTLNIQEIRSLTIAKIRDISENGKPVGGQNKQPVAGGSDAETAAAAEGGATSGATEQPEVRMVQSYGKREPGAGAGADQSSAGLVSALASSGKQAPDLAAIASLDTSKIASFVPPLALPKPDFALLNHKALLKNVGSPARQLNGLSLPNLRPIFFLGPIHGRFERLEQVSAGISRPCVGLNWTRKLGRVQSVAEAVEVYIDLLSRADWSREFQLDGRAGKAHEAPDSERIVDLVGYSYGATIAFELMLAIHKEYRRNSLQLPTVLAPGRLILLDGSPKQIELGSQYMTALSLRSKTLSLSEQVDEMLIWFMAAHTRQANVKIDLIEFQKTIASESLERKVQLASEKLANVLQMSISSQNCNNNEITGEEDANNLVSDDRRVQLAHAMEAFCRKYELISRYKTTTSLPGDCALIRAKDVYLSEASDKEFKPDLDLSSVVKGKVKLYVMDGDHESFLAKNKQEISTIISNYCCSSVVVTE